MKGQAKRFLNQSGKAYDVALKKKKVDEHIGFLDLVSTACIVLYLFGVVRALHYIFFL